MADWSMWERGSFSQGPSREETFELRPGLPGGSNSSCKGPGAGTKLKCAKDRKKISVTGTLSEGEVRWWGSRAVRHAGRFGGRWVTGLIHVSEIPLGTCVKNGGRTGSVSPGSWPGVLYGTSVNGAACHEKPGWPVCSVEGSDAFTASAEGGWQCRAGTGNPGTGMLCEHQCLPHVGREESGLGSGGPLVSAHPLLRVLRCPKSSGPGLRLLGS